MYISGSYTETTLFGTCLLSKLFDTQVARRGRQYHRNPRPYKNRPTKRTVSTKKKIRLVKHTATTAITTAQPNPIQHAQHPTQHRYTTQTQPNPTQREKKFRL